MSIFNTPVNHEERNKFVKDTRILLARLPDTSGDMARLCLRLSIALEVIETIKKDPLTKEEENVLKDIIKKIGNDESLNSDFAAAIGMPEVKFDAITDSAFKKLGNGRVTFVTG